MDSISNISSNFIVCDLSKEQNIVSIKEEYLTDSFVPSDNYNISFTASQPKQLKTHLPECPKKSVEFINDFNKKLGLSAKDIVKKDALMRDSVLSFYRATPALFFNDIFGSYSEKSSLLPNPPAIVINGDTHIGNFGIVKSPEGKAIWGINDFDQSAKGSPEWDLARLASSLALKAREIKLNESDQKKLVEIFSKTYCDTVFSIESGKALPQPYLTHSSSEGAVKKLIEKSSEKEHKDLLIKYTSAADGKLIFKYDNELHPVSQKIREKAENALKSFETDPKEKHTFNIFDVCEKKDSGGSSYGLKRYWVLAANDKNPIPVIIELKQLMPSSVIDRSGDLSKADGKSILDGQKSLGGLQNKLSGYTSIDGCTYLVREREAVKATVNLSKIDNFEKLSQLACQSAKTLAGSHCNEKGNSKLISDWIGGENKTLSSKLADFAILYAQQTEANFKEF